MNFKLVFFLLLILSSLCWSKDGTESHGGDAIVCYDKPLYLINNTIDTTAQIVGDVELKDFWEYSQLSKFDLAQIDEDLDFREIVKLILNKIKNVDPFLGENLLKRYEHYEQDFKFLFRSIIKPIDDSPSDILPTQGHYCYERQAAFNQESVSHGEYSVYVDRAIFERLSPVHKAGLIFHELLSVVLLQELKVKVPERFRGDYSQHLRYYTFTVFSTVMGNSDTFLNYVSSIVSSKFIYLYLESRGRCPVFNHQGINFNVRLAHNYLEFYTVSSKSFSIRDKRYQNETDKSINLLKVMQKTNEIENKVVIKNYNNSNLFKNRCQTGLIGSSAWN